MGQFSFENPPELPNQYAADDPNGIRYASDRRTTEEKLLANAHYTKNLANANKARLDDFTVATWLPITDPAPTIPVAGGTTFAVPGDVAAQYPQYLPINAPDGAGVERVRFVASAVYDGGADTTTVTLGEALPVDATSLERGPLRPSQVPNIYVTQPTLDTALDAKYDAGDLPASELAELRALRAVARADGADAELGGGPALRVDAAGRVATADVADPGVAPGGISINTGGGPTNPAIELRNDGWFAQSALNVMGSTVYATVGTASPGTGGLLVRGLSLDSWGTYLDGVAVALSAATSAAAVAPLMLRGLTASGGNVANPGPTENAVAICAGDQTVQIYKGNGDSHADGAHYANGYDYAEVFETADGQPLEPGTPVAHAGGRRVRPALPGEVPFGVVSATATIIGNCGLSWQGKHLRGPFGRVLVDSAGQPLINPDYVAPPPATIPNPLHDPREPQLVPNAAWDPSRPRLIRNPDHDPDVPRVVEVEGAPRPNPEYRAEWIPNPSWEPPEIPNPAWEPPEIPNPDYDPAAQYVSRADRPEWVAVGLLGQCYVATGAPVAPNWMFLERTSPEAALWLVSPPANATNDAQPPDPDGA